MVGPTPPKPSDMRNVNLRLAVSTEPPATDDTQFIAGMLRRSLTADQVIELVRILQNPEE